MIKVKAKIKFAKEALTSIPGFEFPSANILKTCRCHSAIEQGFQFCGIGVESLESWGLVILSINKKEVEKLFIYSFVFIEA